MLGAMRTRYDQFGKQMIRNAVIARGPVETDAEVPADTRRIDLWFNPGPDSDPPSPDLGLLGRVTERACTVELFHTTPDGEALAACLIKHGNFRHFLALRGAPSPSPMQWVISSGRPDSGIEGLYFHRDEAWPAGVYQGPPLLWTRLMVVSELIEDRSTLLVRLLGAGRVLKRAIAELKALPEGAPERDLALPVLLRLRLEVPANPAARTSDDQEFFMDTQDIVEKWRNEAIQEGVVEGRRLGAEIALSHALIRLYEARFGALPMDLQTRIENTHDVRTLESWLVLAGTGTADDLAAAIRAARAS
ncbi:Hypothetical protein A7982_09689 [Minicystis rosea]|nr:Hypothetical protein A7982_09689 [Minicystis rosea]